jgi:hypothetical protein
MLGSPSAHDALSASISSRVNVRQRAPQLHGVDRWPPRLDEVDEAVVGRDDLGELLLPLLEGPLAAHLAPQRVDQRLRGATVGAVALGAGEQLAPDAIELLGVQSQDVVLVEVAELRRSAGHRRGGGAGQEPGHPRRSLGRGGHRLVVPRRADAVDHLAERPEGHAGLAEARQHALDVVHEHAGRAHDEHAAGLEAATIGVQQVGGAVQRHDRLARAGTAADGGRAAAGGADGLVLLLLDRRDDRVHRAVAGTRQAREQRALADHDEVVRGVVGVEQVVLDADDLVVGAPQHPTTDDTGRFLRGGLVEDRGSRGPPVDQQDLPLGVAHADPSDVAGLPVQHVQPAEDQSVVGRVQRGQALRRLVDHGVALDQPALVAHVAPGHALDDEGLRDLGGRVEPLVDRVDVRLLGRDLPLLFVA